MKNLSANGIQIEEAKSGRVAGRRAASPPGNAPLNRKAKSWLESALSGQETVGFPWSVLLAFLRLTTRPGLFGRPLPIDTAFDLVAFWLDQPSAAIVHPGPRHLEVVRELLLPLGTGGNLTSDAHWLPWPSSTARSSVPRIPTLRDSRA